MTGKRISFALAVATLLLVGAGCTADQQVSIGSVPEHRAPSMPAKIGTQANVNAMAKVEIPTTVDGSVDAIESDGGTELDAQKGVESDAADVDSDSASAKAFGTASYDTDTK